MLQKEKVTEEGDGERGEGKICELKLNSSLEEHSLLTPCVFY